MNLLQSLRIFITIFICISPCLLEAQDFSKADERAHATPFPKNQNLQALASALTEGLTTEKEKARAIFVWISKNICYDVQSFENRADLEPELQQKQALPTEVLRRKKCVCAGYANLFKALCDASGVEALTATGKTKDSQGRVSRGSHAWNLVRTDGEWGLVDPTWGAGDVNIDEHKYTPRFKEFFFLSPPEAFVKDHFPTDPLFQLLESPIEYETFKIQKADDQTLDDKSKKSIKFTHIKDSLDYFAGLDAVGRDMNSAYRMLRFNPNHPDALCMLGQYKLSEGLDTYNESIRENNERIINKTSPSVAWCEQSNEKLKTAVDQLEIAEKYLNQVPPGGSSGAAAAKNRRYITKYKAVIETLIKKNKEDAKILRQAKPGQVRLVAKDTN